MSQTTADAGRWVLDPARSSVRFRSKTFWGLATVKGTFGTVSGEGEVASDGTARGTLTIEAASLDTGNAKRDKHLRSGDFFAADAHASIVFTAGALTAPAEGSGEVQVSGDLAIRGVSRPLTFPARVSLTSPQEATLEAEVSVDRGEFDMKWNQLGMVAATSTVDVTAVYRREG
ncbi:Polyisoprenoid-binding protein YceI [Actinacidiphila yanglinensis]|uniref:Polyisoprenoid-binding protein YceI n=1 Tax=Actinacidiphila yanglinensis TaxID=310779 RepID=A0A1H6CWE6_9ACTN|nr:YceI family protein [Actinacidiphila yanglinensis]SEG77322.1 Polyisoprenoid-binding protein YceI [Actinacidiphila yanglinensis]